MVYKETNNKMKKELLGLSLFSFNISICYLFRDTTQ